MWTGPLSFEKYLDEDAIMSSSSIELCKTALMYRSCFLLVAKHFCNYPQHRRG